MFLHTPLIYLYIYMHLVCAVAGNGVLTFNQDKEIAADDNIDQLLQTEQFLMVVDKNSRKSQTLQKKAENYLLQASSEKQTLTGSLPSEGASLAQARGKELSKSHNCTHSHSRHSFGNSSVRLKWYSIESVGETDDDYLFTGSDLDNSPGQDELDHYRYRRAVTNVGSGQSTMQTQFSLQNGTLTPEQATEGRPENMALKKQIADAIRILLEAKYPGLIGTVTVNSLARGSIIVDCVFTYTSNITEKEFADAFSQVSTLVVGNNIYTLGNIYIGENALIPLLCYQCPPYKECVGNVAECVLKDTRLYPFGLKQGDSTLQKDNEFATKRFFIQESIPWNQEQVRSIYVSVNGIISLDEEFSSFAARPLPVSNKKILAPFWTDMDVYSNDNGEVYYQMYSKYGTFNKTIFYMANKDVTTHAHLDFYDANVVIVLTWHEVGLYPVTKSERVTFQCVIVSDGTTTYAINTYAQGAMQINAILQRDVTVGWGKVNLDTRKANYYTFDQVIGNTDLVGKWIFKLGEKENVEAKCMNWFQENMNNFGLLQYWNSIIPTCPCSEFSAFASGMWLPSYEEDRCYDSFPRFGFFGRRCCYQGGFSFGSFNNRIPFAGSLFTAHPYGSRDTQMYHNKFDVQPKKWCCEQSKLCSLYYAVRPASRCFNMPIFRATSIGDPHIVTLDQQSFIFNGKGEFWVLRVEGNNPVNVSLPPVNFHLQGRTCQATNAAGNLSSATVWCALALNTSNGNRLNVELSTSGEDMVIYANGQDISLRFKQNEKFEEMNQDLHLKNVNGSLKVSTPDSIGITITMANKLLEYVIDIDEMYRNRNMTKGLMGNLNGDKTDDLVYPNGTILPNTTSEKDIFSYGYSWLISESTSLFEYQYGMNFSTYVDLNFEPIFMDEVNDTVRAAAERTCGGPTNLPCIFDYIATQNADLAKNSMASSNTFVSESIAIKNQPPMINGTREFNVTLNATLTFDLAFSDPDKDNFTFNATGLDDVNKSFNPTTGIFSISYTPSKINNETFQIILKDSKGAESEVYIASMRVCTGCSRHGDCDFTDYQVVTPYYSKASCDCLSGYTGADCELDKDGCSNTPCPTSTNCTDVPADEEKATNRSFRCSDCPAGFVLNGTKCEDIDECSRSVSPCDVNAICSNNIGSYQCACKPGFRRMNNRCTDINECTENIHNCAQICINEVPLFSCGCFDGFTFNSNTNNCTRNTEVDICSTLNKTCEYGCRNESGAPQCFCQAGFKLKIDGIGCEDINECEQNICSQDCNNTIGSYSCSCYTGYITSASDKRMCEACSGSSYGVGCRSTCNCKGRASGCDNVKGCLCLSGWTGADCGTDVDECASQPDICPRDQICTNTNGSYVCSCPPGFTLVNRNCQNFNECASFDTNTCSQICTDNPGSFTCSCRAGYVIGPNNTCSDINECEADIDGCEQECENTPGSYNCKCNPGFTVKGDRKTCEKGVIDPCANSNLNCSTGCTIINNTAQCFCRLGYILGLDGATCIDINECSATGDYQHKCSDNCENLPGTYNCSCPVGKSLQNDQRTCQVCDSYHWGEGCSNQCGCYPIGSEACDSVTGCKCKSGWAGTHCMQDIDECASHVSLCPELSDCKNTPGSYHCQCSSGYEMVNRSCVDIDECMKNNPCDQKCTNVAGSYRCSCFKEGFRAVGTKCLDIDECSIYSLHNCEQFCTNTEGSYQCGCGEGFSLNATTMKTCDRLNVTKVCINSSCSHICNIESDVEVCSCRPGYTLNADNKTCEDNNECNSTNPCTNGMCKNVDGGFYCQCSAGFKLAADMVTCQACDFGFYGANCSSTCLCNTTNTIMCNATNGECQCKPGWNNFYCHEDVNECLNSSICPANSVCNNSIGSYRCACNPGYYSNGVNCSICDSTRYGLDCNFPCLCNFANTLTCNSTNGECNCKPGWTGDRCELDINECNITGYCNGSYSQCFNLNGSAECRCLDGYEKLTLGDTCQDINECNNPLLNKCGGFTECNNTVGSYKCQCKVGYQEVNGTCTACDTTHFGGNCSSVCLCNATNTADCNEVTGFCLCNPGWNGTNCDVDIDECASNTSYCSSSVETCRNLIGSAECLCIVGLYRPTTNSSCQGCDSTHYGQDCASLCPCNTTNTADCNDVNGTCTCNDGWTGTNCDQACDFTHYGQNCATPCLCNTTNTADCNDVNGTCTCKPGWVGNNCDQGCDSAHYGQNCASTCPCNTTNTADCNDVNGTCTCNNGWTGANCDQVCDPTHYGQNCAYVCPCITASTADCNDVNGTCTCLPGWTGANCEVLVDQCSNKSFCTNANEACYNTTGTPTCDCLTGFFKPNSGAACQACDLTHYGLNCSNVCQCSVDNSVDCNDVNGTCTCNNGWTGIKCDQGCNSTHYGQNCASTCSCNTTNTADCNDVNGTCTCKPGWVGANCDQGCDYTHYGQNCASTCPCNTTNTADCNNVNGTCTCNNGWTGANCDQVCDPTHYGQNCASLCPCNTTNTADCNDVNGTCTCKPGWVGANCDQGCDSTHYGQNCASTCSCNTTNTADCNDVNGTCTCNEGWTGSNCDQGCDSTHYGRNCAMTCSCITTNTADCNDVNGTCTCKPEWTGSNCDQGCDSTHYGQNCASTCSCITANTADCNDVNGTCTCKPGWTGSNCDQGCDSTHYGQDCSSTCSCNTANTADCNDVNGTCTCNEGWTGSNCDQGCDSTHYGKNCASACLCNTVGTADCNDVNGTCACHPGWSGATCNQEPVKTVLEIKLNVDNYSVDVLNNNTPAFRTYRDGLQAQLMSIGNRIYGQNRSTIIIHYFTQGSLIAHSSLESIDSKVDLTNYVNAVLNTTYTLNNNNYTASALTVNNVTVTSGSSKCDTYQKFNKDCQVCTWTDGTVLPICTNEDNNKDLIIGLAVGIPLFVILAIVVSVVVCLYVRRRAAKKQGSQSDERETPFGQFFATRLDTKGSWGTPSLYKADGFSDAGTSHTSREGQLIRKAKKKTPELHDSAWYPSTSGTTPPTQEEASAEPPAGQASNFSWDYMFQLLEPHKGFEIQRPNVSPSPNPAFMQQKGRDDSIA